MLERKNSEKKSREMELSEQNRTLLSKLGDPQNLWKYFLLLSQKPRVSGDLGEVSAWLKETGKLLGCEVFSDKVGNVLLRQKASPGYEKYPSVCIQAHIDMVCSANEGTEHDFSKDPLSLFIDEGWLKAKGTTLGADNGIGVASALAIFSDPKIKHGPLEALLTVDEETTMAGAEFLDNKLLQSSILMNVDSEEEEAICVGCAGGFEVQFKLPVDREDVKTEVDFYSIFLSSFVGGHTGIDIHRGRGNAIIELARMLDALLDECPSLSLCSFEGGTAVNTIPRECRAIVSLHQKEVEKFNNEINSHFAKIKDEFHPIDTEIAVKVTKITSSQKPSTTISSRKMIDFMLNLPHGVIRKMPHNLKEVETSISFSIVKLNNEHLFCHTFARSSSISHSEFLIKRLKSFARISSAEISEIINPFPGWNPDMKSKALEAVKVAATEVFGKTPRIYSVHAGLECGFIKGQYPDLDCVSIGPDIRGAHSPDERCNISSVDRFYKLLLRSLELLTPV